MKIDRALIIRMSKNNLSCEYADVAAESCEDFGVRYEFIEAVDKADFDMPRQAFKSVGVTKISSEYNDSQPNLGNACCHSSMIKCWRRIVEIDKPCLILEHDAVVVGDPTDIDIPDMSVVTFGHRVSKKDYYKPISPPVELVKIKSAIGVHACGLTPMTAQWLVDDAVNDGIKMGVDRYLIMKCKSGLPLYVCDPPQVVCWVRGSTIRQSKKPDLQNVPESLTKSWKEGLTR